MEGVEALVLEDGQHKGVLLVGLAARIRPVAEGDGQGVCGLVDGLELGRQTRHVPPQTPVVLGGHGGREVRSYRSGVLEFGKDSPGSHVVVGVHLALPVPEDEPVLLDGAVRRRPLDLRRHAELVLEEVLVPPVHQHAEVLHPLPEAGEDRVGAVDGQREAWPVEDAGVVGADIEGKEGQVARTLVAVSYGGRDGHVHGRAHALQAAARLEHGVAHELSKPDGVLDRVPAVHMLC